MKKKKSSGLKGWILIGILTIPLLSIIIYKSIVGFDHKSVDSVKIDENYPRAFDGVKMENPNAYGTPGTDYTDKLEYRVNTTNHTAAVSIGTASFTSSQTALKIPAIYNDGTSGFVDCNVVAIDYSAFANQEYLYSVSFVDASKITLIDAQAFASCPNLSKFNSTVSGSAVIPVNVSGTLGASSFFNAQSLLKLSFSGNKITKIGSNAFEGCIDLKSALTFKVGTGGLIIGDSAFANCIKISSIILPSGVTQVGNLAFYNCRSAKIITIPLSVSYDAASNPTPIGKDAFRLCTSAKAYIGPNARYPEGWPSDGKDINNSDRIGTNYVTVADWNYASNSYAIPITINQTNLQVDDSGLFEYTSSWDQASSIWRINIIAYLGEDIADVTIPEIFPVTGDSSYTTNLVNGEDQLGVVTSSVSYLFSGHSEITSISVPDTMETLPDYFVSECPNLTTFNMGDKKDNSTGLTYYDAANDNTLTFEWLTSYNLTGLTQIGSFILYSASQDYLNITSLTIPATVSIIGNKAFGPDNGGSTSRLMNLSSLVINGASDGSSDLVGIGKCAFYNAGHNATSGTCDLVLPSSLVGNNTTSYASRYFSIGSRAFQGDYFLKSLTIKSQPTAPTYTDNSQIQTYAFNNCIYLRYAVIGNPIHNLSDNAFSCNNTSNSLSWVYIPSGVKIGSAVFSNDIYAVLYSAGPETDTANWNSNWNTVRNYISTTCNEGHKLSISLSTTAYFNVASYTFDTSTVTQNILVTDETRGVQFLYDGTDRILTNNLVYSGLTKIDFSPYDNVERSGVSLPSINKIGDGAFYASAATEIVMPSTITSIGNNSFANCPSLLNVGTTYNTANSTSFTCSLPSGLVSIGDYAFCNDGKIYKFSFGASLQSVGLLSFFRMPALTDIDVNSANTYFKDAGATQAILYQRTSQNASTYILISASGYTNSNVTILSGTTEIASCAFSSLKMTGSDPNNRCVILPDTLVKIDDDAFHCYKNIISGGTSIRKILFTGDSTSATTFTLRATSSLSYIGTNAFCDQANMYYINMPNNPSVPILTIKPYAFARCARIKNWAFPSNTTTKIDDEVTDTDGNYTLADYLFDYQSSNNTNLTSIPIPSYITKIGDYCFHGCNKLTSLPWNTNLKYIGDRAFDGDTKATGTVLFPSSLTYIGNYAFNNCSSLTGIDLSQADSLVSVTTNFGTNVFNACTGLTSVVYGDNLTSIPDNTFYGCSSLTSVTNFPSVSSIGTTAFYGCSSLAVLNLTNNNLTTIGTSAFSGCTSLKESVLNGNDFIIPSTVTSLGDSAFNGCTGLVKVSLGNSGTSSALSSISNNAFIGCTNLVSFVFDKTSSALTSIGTDSFNGCKSLTNSGNTLIVDGTSKDAFIIPSTVTNIGATAFSGCTGLRVVYIPASVSTVGANVFYGTTVASSEVDGLSIFVNLSYTYYLANLKNDSHWYSTWSNLASGIASVYWYSSTTPTQSDKTTVVDPGYAAGFFSGTVNWNTVAAGSLSIYTTYA